MENQQSWLVFFVIIDWGSRLMQFSLPSIAWLLFVLSDLFTKGKKKAKEKWLFSACVWVQASYGTCHHAMLWRCQSSRMPLLFWPIASSYPSLTGTPPPITMMTASSTFIPPRCCAMLPAASGKTSLVSWLNRLANVLQGPLQLSTKMQP